LTYCFFPITLIPLPHELAAGFIIYMFLNELTSLSMHHRL